MTQRLGDRVTHWITHNEPFVVSMVGNMQGRHVLVSKTPLQRILWHIMFCVLMVGLCL
ncbi:MAG: family 1 glycosylhydrolase [Chloroflexota bacterium]